MSRVIETFGKIFFLGVLCLTLIVGCSMFLGASSVEAATGSLTDPSDAQELKYVPLVNLPGYERSENTLGNPVDFLQTLFFIGLTLAAFLAVVMIMWGGILYMTSDAVSGKSAGKEKIQNAIFGLLIALLFITVLRTINPQLTQFKFLVSQVTIQAAPTTIAPRNATEALRNANENLGREQDRCWGTFDSGNTHRSHQRRIIDVCADAGRERGDLRAVLTSNRFLAGSITKNREGEYVPSRGDGRDLAVAMYHILASGDAVQGRGEFHDFLREIQAEIQRRAESNPRLTTSAGPNWDLINPETSLVRRMRARIYTDIVEPTLQKWDQGGDQLEAARAQARELCTQNLVRALTTRECREGSE